MADLLSGGLKGRYLSAFDCIARSAPHLMALAQASLARRSGHAAVTGDPGDCEDQSVLRVFLAMQADEGRKQRLVVHDGEAVRQYQGVALQKRYLDRAKASLAPGAGLQEIALHLLRHIKLLDLLAKGRRVATSILAARPGEMRDYVQGLESLGGAGAHGIRHAPDGHGKRQRAAANRVNAAQKPEAFVQPPDDTAPVPRFTPQELAGLAFLCDIDGFQISLQHLLLCPEIWAARALRTEVQSPPGQRGRDRTAANLAGVHPCARAGTGPYRDVLPGYRGPGGGSAEHAALAADAGDARPFQLMPSNATAGCCDEEMNVRSCTHAFMAPVGGAVRHLPSRRPGTLA
ncbi:hypothetical protein E2976_02950 (plasmid) [Paracoccus yeei]|uniref:hypothetical protein n=1 Tax=Paracoccus yeei TaxID=147645 RepID=UPI003BF7EFC1